LSERAPLYRNVWLWAFFLGILTLTAIRPLLRHVPEPPPVLGQVPDFSLVDQDGRPFGSAELRGRVYIASFFFTRCPSICPMLMQSVKRLQDGYREKGIDGIRLVSVSVDPEHDTPERLGAYGEDLGADPARWALLTGELEAIRALASDGFKVPVGSPEAGPGGLVDIAHTGKLVLVDPEGGIRGYYDTDRMGLDEVFHRAQHVLREKRR